MLKKAIAGGLVLAAAIGLCGRELAADAAGQAPAQQTVDRACGDDGTMMASDLFARVLDVTEGADNADELLALLEDDPLVRASGLIPGSDTMISSINAGDCHLSPLLCLFRWHTPDLRCVYDCIGLRGTGEITCRQQEACVLLAGCMLFENCLALCISIIPYDLQPIIWW